MTLFSSNLSSDLSTLASRLIGSLLGSRDQKKVKKSREGKEVKGREDFVAADAITVLQDFVAKTAEKGPDALVKEYLPNEDGRPKCVVYWPQNVDDKLDFPSITVTHRGEGSDQFNTITLIIELNASFDTTGMTEAQKLPLVVKLFRWTTWPDRGVPDKDTSWLVPIQLLDIVRNGPTVVHCSAGIGRTGSILVLEIALQRIAQRKNVDLEQITRDLRRFRCQCVQNEVQYLYIHRILVENSSMHVNLGEKYKEAAAKFLAAYDEKLKVNKD